MLSVTRHLEFECALLMLSSEQRREIVKRVDVGGREEVVEPVGCRVVESVAGDATGPDASTKGARDRVLLARRRGEVSAGEQARGHRRHNGTCPHPLGTIIPAPAPRSPRCAARSLFAP